jgi:rhomboid protease GluP
MCPHCRAFITTDDRVCPYCDTPVGPRAVDRRGATEQLIGGFIPHARFTTTILLLINFGLYIATALYSMNHSRGGGFMDVDGQTLAIFGASLPHGHPFWAWWRLITAGFLHGGLLHIGMNSWVLFDLGAQVEDTYGTPRFLAIYILSTIGGFWLSGYTGHFSVGASAAIFGLIGAMIAVGVREKSSYGSAVRGMYVRWAIYGLAFSFLPGLNIDFAAHLGGMAAGFVVGYMAGTPRVRGEWLWTGVAAVCVALTAFAFVNMYLLFATVSRELAR